MPRLPEGVPQARHRVQEAMREWGEPDDRVEAAALVVTELVANAVQHTSGRRVRCRLLRSPGGVRICVWNRGRARVPAPTRPMDAKSASHGSHGPTPRRPELSRSPGDGPHGPGGRADADHGDLAGAVDGPDITDIDSLAEDGRGLMLVDALATRWGTRTSLSSRLVWADV
ncbi:ATP-binding protein [Streptomyces sp. NBC_00887]|nr:ATP-binding protein [Streptomyces sp. NBC_00887]WSY36821.1 ATP-binding protein [Streptomyces sp. NBC_00887]